MKRPGFWQVIMVIGLINLAFVLAPLFKHKAHHPQARASGIACDFRADLKNGKLKGDTAAFHFVSVHPVLEIKVVNNHPREVPSKTQWTSMVKPAQGYALVAMSVDPIDANQIVLDDSPAGGMTIIHNGPITRVSVCAVTASKP